MLERVADWHGDKAASAYSRWLRSEDENDLRDFYRHTSIADRIWRRAAIREAA